MRLCQDKPPELFCRFLTDKLLIWRVRLRVTPFDGDTEILLQRSAASKLGFKNILFCSWCAVGAVIFSSDDMLSLDNSSFGTSWLIGSNDLLISGQVGTTWSSFWFEALVIILVLLIRLNCLSTYILISVAEKRSPLVVNKWFFISFLVASETRTSLGRTSSHWQIFLKSATVVDSTKGKFEKIKM